jgi:hypothetical protein
MTEENNVGQVITWIIYVPNHVASILLCALLKHPKYIHKFVKGAWLKLVPKLYNVENARDLGF